MAINETRVLSVTVDRSVEDVFGYLADPFAYPAWANKFFTGAVTREPNGDLFADIKMMGGKTGFSLEVDDATNFIDMRFARLGKGFGEPTRVRLIPNNSGTDVLWVMTRVAGSGKLSWKMGNFFMQLELNNLKRIQEDK